MHDIPTGLITRPTSLICEKGGCGEHATTSTALYGSGSFNTRLMYGEKKLRISNGIAELLLLRRYPMDVCLQM